MHKKSAKKGVGRKSVVWHEGGFDVNPSWTNSSDFHYNHTWAFPDPKSVHGQETSNNIERYGGNKKDRYSVKGNRARLRVMHRNKGKGLVW